MSRTETQGHNDGLEEAIPVRSGIPPDRCERLKKLGVDYGAGREVPLAAWFAAIPDISWIDRSRLRRRVTLTIARTWTIENVLPVLDLLGALHGLDLAVQLRPFGVLQQEILDPHSPIYRQPADYLLLLWRLEDFMPDLHASWGWSAEEVQTRVHATTTRITALIQRLEKDYPGVVLAFDFGLDPLLPQEDILATTYPYSPANLRQVVNQRVRTESAGGSSRVRLLSLGKLQCRLGSARWNDERLRLTAGCPCSANAQIAVLEETIRAVAAEWPAIRRKVLLLDGDNTLWGGVLAEDGPEGIQLGAEYPGNVFAEVQQRILRFYQCGMVLGLCSKNREAEVKALFARHPGMVLKPEHIAIWEVNWRPKSENVLAIAERLQLGLEAFVFIDDSPQEREEVRQRCRGVLVPDVPDQPMQRHAFWTRFQPFPQSAISREDRLRTPSYRAEEHRHAMKSQAPTLEEFYRGLGMRARLRVATIQDAARIAQMTQRTNQFNATTIRLTEADIAQRLSVPGCRYYLLELSDRFGESGVIGCAEVGRDGDTAVLAQFLLSCRVLQRTVERHFLGRILQANLGDVRCLRLRYVPSPRNRMVLDFFRELGDGETTATGQEWRLPVSRESAEALLQPWIEEY